jgi:2,4-dienoyl-CoA reductase-like NADH-dependent reductase (Old Yellow Enzyme family)
MSLLFEKETIGSLTIPNRFVRSATTEGLADKKGHCRDEMIPFIKKLADGECGLIIMGYAYVAPEGKQLPFQTGIYTDEHTANLKKVCEDVHQTGSKIALQIVHVGGQTSEELNDGYEPIGPSAILNPAHKTTPREMDLADIKRVMDDFVQAARRTKEAGFDAVQLHGAHGYLLNQFLSPFTNKRADNYGGNIENRCRFVLEVFNAVREEVGKNYPVFMKLNSDDFYEGALTLSDSLYCAKMLEEAGIDAIEVSGGTPYSGRLGPTRMKINKPEQEAYFLDQVKNFKKELKVPIIAVGGFRSFEIAEQTVSDKLANFISMSRPFVREPGLVKRWKSGDRTKAKCVSCSRCFRETYSERGLGCYQERQARPATN